jgi:hypothetical protein
MEMSVMNAEMVEEVQPTMSKADLVTGFVVVVGGTIGIWALIQYVFFF